MTTLSLAHLTVLDASPTELIEAAAAGGFNAVGLRIMPPFLDDTIMPVVGHPGLVRDIKARMAQLGVSILDVEAVWLMPHTDVDALAPVLDLAVELGARHVLTVGNDPEAGRLTANLSRFGAACQARGLRVMLEFIPYAVIDTLPAAVALLRNAAPANAGILVDALHLSRSGAGPADLASFDPALFSYVHLCDAPAAPPAELRPEARSGRLLPGEGGLDLQALILALPPGTPAAVEAPCARYASLPVMERAELAGAAARRMLAFSRSAA